MMRLVIPQLGDEPVTWTYYVMQAARGGVRVPDMLYLALPCVVGESLGIRADEVEHEHVERIANKLPEDPVPVLRPIMRIADLQLPRPGTDEPRLQLDAGRGSFRASVGFPDLMHDASLMVLSGYGPDGFFAAFEAAHDKADWDSRAAVAAMMYLFLARKV